MTIFLAQVTLNRSSNIPKDRVVNTFHFATEGAGVLADATDIHTALAEFYNQPLVGGGLRLFDHLGGLSTLGHRIKVYDLADPEPRAAVLDEDFVSTSVGSTGLMLPAEVALCLSYAAPPASGVPVARTRGRIYLGPWAGVTAVEGTAADADARPAATLRTFLTGIGKRLMERPVDEPIWSVYSPTDDTSREIRTVWCDDAWDTQRRRGALATTRTTVTHA